MKALLVLFWLGCGRQTARYMQQRGMLTSSRELAVLTCCPFTDMLTGCLFTYLHHLLSITWNLVPFSLAPLSFSRACVFLSPPHSFATLVGISFYSLLRGKVPALVRELIKDTRRMMSPYTALKLKERKSNSLKDYLALSGTLGVSHLLCFSTTETGTYLRYLYIYIYR